MKISVFIVFSTIICGAFSNIPKSAHDRVKRWKDGGGRGPSDLSNMFRGTAGVDYPDLKSIPSTSFRCENQEIYEGGLYADVETRCQVYHVCHDGRKDSFMCGKGTIFNQQILACDYWYSAECDNAPSYYYLNSQIGNSVSSDTNNQNYPNGNSQNYPNGNQQNYPRGHQQTYPSGNQQTYPSGNQQTYPSGNQQTYPSGNQQTYPSGNQQNYPSGNQQISGRIDSTNNRRVAPNTGSHGGHNENYPNKNQPISGRIDSTSNSRVAPNTGSHDGHSDKPCECIKNSNVRPWSFPAFPGNS